MVTEVFIVDDVTSVVVDEDTVVGKDVLDTV